MKKLPCFGITAHALQILTNTNTLVEQLDSRWFNWVGAVPANVTGYTPYAPRRLQIVCADPLSKFSAARWYKNTLDAGYECAFICAANEEPSIDEIKGLPDDLYYSLVYSHEDDRERNDELLSELRELDTSLGLHWENLLQGGGAPIEMLGFTEVSPQQWWSYGQAAYDWIQATKGEAGRGVRIATPDYSAWNPWAHIGVPNRALTLAEHFDTPTTDTWQCSVQSPLTKEQIPALGSDIEAFWPMRQMPACGVVRTTKGVLKAVGALPDIVVNGNWLWDDGSIRAALQLAAINPVKVAATMYENLKDWLGQSFVLLAGSTSRPPLTAAFASTKKAKSPPVSRATDTEWFVRWTQTTVQNENPLSVGFKIYVVSDTAFIAIEDTSDVNLAELNELSLRWTSENSKKLYPLKHIEEVGAWQVVGLEPKKIKALARELDQHEIGSKNRLETFAKKEIRVC